MRSTEEITKYAQTQELGNKESQELSQESRNLQNLEAEKKYEFINMFSRAESAMTRAAIEASRRINRLRDFDLTAKLKDERGDVPGWVLVVLMTTGLVTAIWTIAAPRLTTILKGSLDAMNGIR